MSSAARQSSSKTSAAAPGGSGSSPARPVTESTLKAVRTLAEREKLFRRVRKVLVALSGGADSTACLLLLKELSVPLEFEVVACHFDHMLRHESKTDMEAVRALCDSLEVECITGEGDVRGVSNQMKRGIEEMAREMRYQFLAFVAEKVGADCIATGHTADDQAETILMRIVRGSGIRGIRGMLPVSEVPGAEAQRLIRPLLETPKASTVAICAEFGVTPLEDASNSDLKFTRNRIRAEVLPALAVLNPSVRAALIGLGESAREAFEPIERRSYEIQPSERGPVGAIFDAAKFEDVPAEALGLVIEREAMFFHLQPETNRTRVQNLQEVLAGGSGSVVFADTEVEVSSGKVRIGPPLEEVEPFPSTVLDVPGATRAGPWRVDVLTDEIAPTPDAPVVSVDSSKCAGAFRVRPLEPGDRIVVNGIERKVSDLLINEKVPLWERVGTVVVADNNGVVALFGAKRSFVRDGSNPDLWIRLSAIPQR
ncbi:MAG: tRNA lysidine(34) synthetase TilS [Dehalococcoidia bacterium]